MPVEIIIQSNRSNFREIAQFLNTSILEEKEIVGTDGVRRKMTKAFDSAEQSTLFTKIESLSSGELHVVRAQE